MYSLRKHGDMIRDGIRMQAYARALRRAVTGDSVVVDIGTGTGVFALLACQYGARRVHAIEPDDVIQVARELAAANGFQDRVIFHQEVSTRVELPDKADVVVSDVRGVLPLYGRSIPSIIDARKRFLGPQGVLIPERDTLWAAPVAAPGLHDSCLEPWQSNDLGLDLRVGAEMLTCTPVRGRVKAEQLLAPAVGWGTIDYATVEDPDLRAEPTWTVQRGETGHGLLLWFDTDLANGIEISNAPGEPENIWGSLFLPWSRPVELSAGDGIRVEIRADLVEEEYIWRWKSEVGTGAGSISARFDQSNYFGVPLTSRHLHQQAPEFIPSLLEQGEVDRLILDMMDGQHSNAEITDRICREFPERFSTREKALAKVGELALRYSR